MTQTEHYQLNQWSASDRIHHDDFNADNLRLDEALTQKLGQLELISVSESNNQSVNGTFLSTVSKINWDEWSFVCMLVHYPEQNLGNVTIDCSMLSNEYKEERIASLTVLDYLVVFLPLRDASRPAAGIIFADRFTPFSASFPFRDIKNISTGPSVGQLICPSTAFFGSK